MQSSSTTERWSEPTYRHVDRVRGGWDDSVATIRFENGDIVTLDLSTVVPATLVDVDWWRVAANQDELIVPHAGGWYAIAWDVVRRATDPHYFAHWEAVISR